MTSNRTTGGELPQGLNTAFSEHVGDSSRAKLMQLLVIRGMVRPVDVRKIWPPVEEVAESLGCLRLEPRSDSLELTDRVVAHRPVGVGESTVPSDFSVDALPQR